jgi:hypothetical protein
MAAPVTPPSKAPPVARSFGVLQPANGNAANIDAARRIFFMTHLPSKYPNPIKVDHKL